MYGRRKRKHGRSSRRRIIRKKNWLDKRGRAQQMAVPDVWQDKTGFSKVWC